MVHKVEFNVEKCQIEELPMSHFLVCNKCSVVMISKVVSLLINSDMLQHFSPKNMGYIFLQ